MALQTVPASVVGGWWRSSLPCSRRSRWPVRGRRTGYRRRGMMMGGDDGDSAPLIGHGFLLDGDVFTAIDHPDAVDETGVTGINSRGQIVGGYVDAEGTVRSFLLDDGVFTRSITPCRRREPLAFGINDRGQIVGFYIDADGRVHGFLFDKRRGARRDEGVFTTFDHPGCRWRRGPDPYFGINDRGRIVGTYIDPGGKGHGFVRDKGRDARRDEGVFTTIDFPGAAGTLAVAINNRDQILGTSIDFRDQKARVSASEKGEFTAIDHPDATSEVEGGGTGLFGLNDHGQIVGQYPPLALPWFPAGRRYLHHDR